MTPSDQQPTDDERAAAWTEGPVTADEFAILRAASRMGPPADLEHAGANIAARFGFDQPAWLNVNGRKIDARRRELGMSLSEFTAALIAAGEHARQHELLSWLQAANQPIARHTATCIAAILDVSVSSLVSAEPLTTRQTAFANYLDSGEFGSRVSERSTELGTTPTDLRRRVEREMFALAARADDISVDQVRTIAQTILDGIES